MESDTAAVEATGLAKTFGNGGQKVDVIRDLDFRLSAGSFGAIMGPSGSGKSTLLHILAGLLLPDSGSVKIGGRETTGMNDREMTIFRRRKIGLIFQDFNLIPTLTAEENIALPILLDRGGDAAGKIEPLIRSLGISHRRDHLPSKLSGGERQRVAIARALAVRPDVVLADEPTGNLDTPAARGFCELLRKLNAETGCAILLATHDPMIAAASDRVHILKDGAFVDEFDSHGDAALVSEKYLAAMNMPSPENKRED